jgi:hypothetical protein
MKILFWVIAVLGGLSVLTWAHFLVLSIYFEGL